MLEIEEQPELEIEAPPPKPKNKGGRPRKDPTLPKVLDAPNPPFTKFDSNHRNPPQRTAAAWAWWNKLTDPVKNIIEAHVYRDWPVLLDPPEGEFKYIDVIIGTDPIQTDQDFIDKYGAGKYHIYLNANPAASESRRTLFTAFIDGSHDTTKYPPCDKRIQNVENISLTDPANAAYVAALRANGKLPDPAKEQEVATATAGLTEVLSKSLDRGDRLMEKLIEERTAEPQLPSDPPPSAEEKLNESLTLLEKLQNFTKGSPTADPMAMMTAVIEAAKVMSQSNNPQSLTPFMDRIAALESQLRTQESEMLRSQLSEIKDQLRTLKEAPQSNITLADGTSVESIINKVVDRLADKPEDNPWLDIVKSAMPAVLPLLGGIAQRFLAPPQPPPAFPMPPATYQAGAPPQPQQQAQLPAPAQPRQAPPQPQAGGAYTTGNPQLDALLMAVVIPLADCLRDGETGGVFAEDFIESQGIETHTMLSQVGVDPIANIIANYPPLAGVMKKVPRDKLMQFVTEFVQYKEAPAEPPST